MGGEDHNNAVTGTVQSNDNATETEINDNTNVGSGRTSY